MRGPQGQPGKLSGRRKWEASVERDEDEQARRRLAELAHPRPSRSRIETWRCICTAWARPSRTPDKASCDVCGRPDPRRNAA